MKYQVHHVAINVKDLEWYRNFFESVLEMTVRKTAGDAPHRKIWYEEGLQLNESTYDMIPSGVMDHFALSAPDVDAIVARCVEAGASKIDGHWIQLPNGVKIEFQV